MLILASITIAAAVIGISCCTAGYRRTDDPTEQLADWSAVASGLRPGRASHYEPVTDE